jgi:predicted MPP superfamily phosphohydrolase
MIRVLVVDDDADEKRRRSFFARLFDSQMGEQEYEIIYCKVKPNGSGINVIDEDDLFEKIAIVDVALIDIFLRKDSNRQVLSIHLNGSNIVDEISSVRPGIPIFLYSHFFTKDELEIFLRTSRKEAIVDGFSIRDVEKSGNFGFIRGKITAAVLGIVEHLGIEPNESIIALQISDLQFGGDWFGSTGNMERDAEILAEDIYRTSMTNKRSAKIGPDIIFLTGDVAQTASCREYEGASIFMDRLLESLKLDPRMVFVIPGNHDRNARLAAADMIEVVSKKKKAEDKINLVETQNDLICYSLAPFKDFCEINGFSSFWNCRISSGVLNPATGFGIYEYFSRFGLDIVLVDSTNDFSIENFEGRGVSDFATTEIPRQLREHRIRFGENLLIVLMHHSPWMEVFRRDKGDLELKLFLQGLGSHLPLIFLTGHAHQNIVFRRSLSEGNDKQVVRIGCPSAILKKVHRPEDSFRGYNRLTIRRKNHKVDRVVIDVFGFSGREASIYTSKEYRLSEQAEWVIPG